jgi:hypothetical protein
MKDKHSEKASGEQPKKYPVSRRGTLKAGGAGMFGLFGLNGAKHYGSPT